jgi:hypothetical protein
MINLAWQMVTEAQCGMLVLFYGPSDDTGVGLLHG